MRNLKNSSNKNYDSINLINRTTEDGEHLWSFTNIIGHRREKKGVNRWKLRIKWDNGEDTWEPLKSIWHTDPVTVAQYSEKHKLFGLAGWRWAKSYVGNGHSLKLLRNIHCTNKKHLRNGTKYQFGITVPRTTKQAYLFDKQNGNTLWEDAINEEMNKIMNFETFEILDDGEQLANAFHYICASQSSGMVGTRLAFLLEETTLLPAIQMNSPELSPMKLCKLDY